MLYRHFWGIIWRQYVINSMHFSLYLIDLGHKGASSLNINYHHYGKNKNSSLFFNRVTQDSYSRNLMLGRSKLSAKGKLKREKAALNCFLLEPIYFRVLVWIRNAGWKQPPSSYPCCHLAHSTKRFPSMQTAFLLDEIHLEGALQECIQCALTANGHSGHGPD